MQKKISECGCGCGESNGGCQQQENSNYMFFQNLKTIKSAIESMLQMDTSAVDKILRNGHDWAVDHIATSKDDVEEVAGFLMNSVGIGQDDYNMQQPQFVPMGFKNHLKKLMPERIEKTESGYFATTGDGRRLSKTPKSKKAALSQLAAVEISKHKK
jgi:hypothetical protein